MLVGRDEEVAHCRWVVLEITQDGRLLVLRGGEVPVDIRSVKLAYERTRIHYLK